MKTIHTKSDLSSWIIENCDEKSTKLGFVPTMGALHSGHASLMKKASEECDFVVASILINPTQFENPSDLASYPSTLDSDLLIASAAGVDVIFAPTAEEVYGGKPLARDAQWGDLTNTLEGAFRQGHFNGMIAVVDKLFHIVAPDRAYFGTKDLQQLAVVKKLADLEHKNIKIIGCELIRDDSGLALSSRNRRLSAEGTQTARTLFKSLLEAKDSIARGINATDAISLGIKRLTATPKISLEYFTGVNGEDFDGHASPKSWTHIVVSAEVEGVRLIDNIYL